MAIRTRTGSLAPAAALSALRDARPVPFWLDSPLAPPPRPALVGEETCDLAVVGGGFTGLWAAVLAKQRDAAQDVVVLDAGRIGAQASGRNGGFCAASLTHGVEQAAKLFPSEAQQLVELGMRNLDEIERFVTRHSVDCAWERTGEMDVATREWHVEGLREEQAAYEQAGIAADWFDRDALQEEVRSPTYMAGLWHHDAALVDPARLAWGLARVAEEHGTRFFEDTPVLELTRCPGGVRLVTPWGAIRARRVVLATNAFKPLLRRLRLSILPLYDYALVTEPLSADQIESIGWRRRQGLADAGYLFHYYRLTADQRILWGGWDAVYAFGSRVSSELEQRPRTFATLARQFFETFPQLAGLRFTHRWGGVIDTCSRICAFYGTAMGGRVAYSLGYTGLGVAASRVGAQVALDLLGGKATELTTLRMVRSRPLPFPPEPLRFPVVEVTRISTERAERNDGERNLWLRALDSVGLGFDS